MDKVPPTISSQNYYKKDDHGPPDKKLKSGKETVSKIQSSKDLQSKGDLGSSKISLEKSGSKSRKQSAGRSSRN